MSLRFLLVTSVLIGQFLLLVMPGMVRAMIQLPGRGVAQEELYPLPFLLLFAATLSYLAFRFSRQLRALLWRGEEEAAARKFSRLRGALPESRWMAFHHRRFLRTLDAPLLGLRFTLLLVFMWVESPWMPLAGLLAAAACIGLMRSPRFSREEGAEFSRFFVFQALPACFAFVLLAGPKGSAVYVASLFLFFGLLMELAFSFEWLLGQWAAAKLEEKESALLTEIDRALEVVELLPSGRIAFPAPEWAGPAQGAGDGAALILVNASARAGCHLIWRNSRLEHFA